MLLHDHQGGGRLDAEQGQEAEIWSPSEPRLDAGASPADGDPLPPPGSTDQAPTAPRPPRNGGGRGALPTVLVTSVLAAVLASGGTYALLANDLHQTSSTPEPTANAIVTGNQPTPSVSPSASASGSTSAEDALVGIVAKARQSVVTITADGVSSGFGPFNIPSTGVGSGIVITADGYILTNRHVVEGSRSLTVALADGREFPATIVKIASDNDLALVKIDASSLSAASIGNSDALEVGQTAIAIGSPLGTYTETVTKGIVSGLDRDVSVTDEQTGRPTSLHHLIQTDAAINPGNSGGPLLDAGGNVIGLNTAIASSAEGLGFAIPINAASELIALASSATA
jgi:serine protease Do